MLKKVTCCVWYTMVVACASEGMDEAGSVQPGRVGNETRLSAEIPRSALRLQNFCEPMGYAEMRECIPTYFDFNAHKFNTLWWDTLELFKGETLLDAIKHDDLNDLSKKVRGLYAWCEVTTHVMHYHKSYIPDDEYKLATHRDLKLICGGVKRGESAIVDTLVGILSGLLAIFP